MSPQPNSATAISPFGQKVLNAFCDVVAKDAANRNDTIRIENECIQPAYEALRKVKLNNAQEQFGEIDIACYDQEDGTHYAYLLEAEFPKEDMRKFEFKLCGVRVLTDFFRSPPQLSIEGNSVQVRINFMDVIILEGTLKNQPESLEEVQEMIDSNRIARHWAFMGMINTATGLPALLNDNALQDSTFCLDCVKISKQAIEPVISLAMAFEGPNQDGDDHGAGELELLAESNSGHSGICEASDRQKSLTRDYKLFRMGRDIFQSLVIRNPNVGILYQFKLETGSIARLMTGRDVRPAWRLEPANRDEATVLLSSLSNFQPTLAGVPILDTSGATGAQDAFPDFPGFILRWGMFSTDLFGLEALFAFDESCLNYIQDRNFAQRLRMTLIPEDQQDNHYIEVDDQRAIPIADMTVRLCFIQIRLDAIRSNLELLGVDVSSLEEAYRAQHEDMPADDEQEGED